MDWREHIRRRVAGLKLNPAREAEIIEELAQHLADFHDEARAAGAGETEACRQTLDELATGALARELLRAERPAIEPMPPLEGHGGNMFEGVWQDVRYGTRVLRKNPLFSLVVVLTLALGIGANTATFSVLHALLIRPLPYHDPDQVTLVLGWDSRRNSMRFNMPMSELLQWHQSPSFEQAGAYQYWSANLVGAGEPERLQAYRVTSNMFALLGVEPALGRAFGAEDGRPGAPGVAVLNYGVWQRRFGSDPGVVGRVIQLDDEPYTIIGVMPSKFEFPQVNYKGDLWVPMRFNAAQYPLGQPSPSVVAIARLRREVPLARAQAELDGIYARVVEQNPALAGRAARLTAMKELFAQDARPVLWMLMGAVGFVLLIACANVANLVVSRALGREREVAIRAAVGASRTRLVRQMLTESILLGATGGLAGVGLAFWSLRGLRAAIPESVITVVPAMLEIGLNPAVLVFALCASIATGILFGILPALRISKTDLSLSLKEGGRASAGRPRHRMAQTLVVAEVALSLVLLAGAGLMLRSLTALLQASPGFAPQNVLVAEVSLPAARYADTEKQRQFFERVLQRAAALPGAESVAVINRHPFSTSNTGTVLLIAGQPEPEAGDLPRADYREASPDYFHALRIPLLAGRGFAAQDTEGAPRVAIVNQTFARQYLAQKNPVGQQIRFGDARSTDAWRTIVGVVGDIRHWDMRREPSPEVYVPLAQETSPRMTLVVRAAGDPRGLIPALRTEVQAVDPNQPIYAVEPMVQTVERAAFSDRFLAGLMGVFAALALALAGVGIYGVMSSSVTDRWHEIGIRMALGAQRGDVTRLVVGKGLALAGLGVAIGLAAALGLTRLMASILYGVKPHDPLTFVGGAAVLLATAMIACYVPARRATRVDPIVALRYE